MKTTQRDREIISEVRLFYGYTNATVIPFLHWLWTLTPAEKATNNTHTLLQAWRKHIAK